MLVYNWYIYIYYIVYIQYIRHHFWDISFGTSFLGHHFWDIIFGTSFLGHGVNIASPLPSDQIDWTPWRSVVRSAGRTLSVACSWTSSIWRRPGWAAGVGPALYPAEIWVGTTLSNRSGIWWIWWIWWIWVARRFGCLPLFAHNKMRWTTGFGGYPIFWQARLATEFTAAGIRWSEEKMGRDNSEWRQALHMEGIWNEMPKYCKSQNYWIHKLTSMGICIWWLTLSFVQKQCTIPEPVKVLKGTHRAAGKARCFLGSAGAWGWASGWIAACDLTNVATVCGGKAVRCCKML